MTRSTSSQRRAACGPKHTRRSLAAPYLTSASVRATRLAASPACLSPPVIGRAARGAPGARHSYHGACGRPARQPGRASAHRARAAHHARRRRHARGCAAHPPHAGGRVRPGRASPRGRRGARWACGRGRARAGGARGRRASSALAARQLGVARLCGRRGCGLVRAGFARALPAGRKRAGRRSAARRSHRRSSCGVRGACRRGLRGCTRLCPAGGGLLGRVVRAGGAHERCTASRQRSRRGGAAEALRALKRRRAGRAGKRTQQRARIQRGLHGDAEPESRRA